MAIPNKWADLFRGYAREVYFGTKLRADLRGIEHRNPILVYQMGKVGSSTVTHTLDQLDLQVPVLHLHTLSRDNIRFATRRQRQSARPYLPEHLITSRVLERTVGTGISPCRIITLTREPVGRAVSFAFEDRAKQAPDALRRDGTVDPDRMTTTVTHLLTSENGVADPTRWFDGELKACFGIDVFAQPYDLEHGYTILRRDDVSVLVMRMEDLNRALPMALSVFLGLPQDAVEMSRANVGAHKSYAPALDHVKATLRLSPEVMSRVTGTKYFQHFYAADLRHVTSRWSTAEMSVRSVQEASRRASGAK